MLARRDAEEIREKVAAAVTSTKVGIGDEDAAVGEPPAALQRCQGGFRESFGVGRYRRDAARAEARDFVSASSRQHH